MPGLQLRKRQQYETLKAKLWLDRSSSEALWRDLANFEKPTRVRFQTTDRNRNDKRNQNILDETAVSALDTLESGLHAGMSSPARPWFQLTVPDPSLNAMDSVKGYLYDVKERMNAVFALSNLYNALPEVYGDVSTFGTAAMVCFEDQEDLVRFYTYPLGSYAIGLNARREVCTFVLEEQFTIRQVIEEFATRDTQGNITNSENFSPYILDKWKNGDTEANVDLCWIVMPNDRYNESKLDSKYLPFASTWFEKATQSNQNHDGVLRESGFRTFPVMTPRWKTTGNDSYGTNCPGISMLSAVKQLQMMERKSNQVLAKFVDPPTQAPAEMKNQPTSLVAGHISYTPRGGTDGRITTIHEMRLEGYQLFEEKADRVRARINEIAFKSLFLMFASQPYGQPMTATEVNERHQEKLLVLGPALERMNEELLEKVIDRTFDVMASNGLLPQPPEELQGVTVKVEFTSVLAEAQKLTRVTGIDALLARTMPLAELAPEILDKIDFSELVDDVAQALGTNPKIIRSNEDVQARVAARAKQAQAQAAAEQASQMAGAAKDLGSTPLGGDTALSGLLQTAGAA
jgi:hypothetical protein